MSISTCVGQRAGNVLPRGAPDCLGIRGDLLEEIDFILDGKRWINASCDEVVAINRPCNDFTARSTEAVQGTEQFP